ncbi:PTS sugar transporter subunit IIA [Microbacterium sp. MPKO10]|uniref:PTS sugar transporter subunit IIA n=1 Tax=Microbacterium sp. MPKO10 TaxID=2989818 RepID=UPI0022358F13|nr:PTS sugar transporter subunit IIA [Microbacterium sp. MPKO10]MCW4457771.1 PTS sugar transporter subunit IIA [Microbacterium sp. MPKO10]
MPLPPLPDSALNLGASARDWKQAVMLAGKALELSGAVTADYAKRMVQVVEEFGAYIVIAPGLALAHARPGPDVHAEGLSVVTLTEPVLFGHPYNDPVSVVIGLAVQSSEEHVAGVAALANVFNNPSTIGELAAATTPESVRSILGIAHEVSS